LVSFKNNNDVINCQEAHISAEQMAIILNAIKDENIAKYVEKQLIKNCSTINE
jgi:hypothetical protein